MAFYGSSLIFDVESGHLRLGLRVYFTALFFLLGLIGDQCCNLRVKLRLLQRYSVDIPLMTGWLNGFSAATTWITQRRSPAGWLGLVMIVAQLLNFAADLLVSGLVQTINIESRCAFGTGIVIPLEPVAWRSIPDLNQPATNLVTQAQITSQSNGGLAGIFWKVNADPNFRADPQDVVGYWVCDIVNNDIVYPTNISLTSQDVFEDLMAKGFLYQGSSLASGTTPGSGWNNLVAWGSSVEDEVQQLWDVRASVDITVNESDYNPHAIRNFHCSLNASSIEWIINQMDGQSSLLQWVFALRGSIETGNTTSIGSKIVTMLETMTQIGWGGKISVNDTSQADPTIGCLAPRAAIPIPVFLLLVAVTIGLLCMLSYWTTLLFLVHSKSSTVSKRYAKCVKETTPNGLLGWMAQAVREHGVGGTVEAKDVKQWKVYLNDYGRLEIQGKYDGVGRADGNHNSLTVLNYELSKFIGATGQEI
jgi:hypothetical protein